MILGIAIALLALVVAFLLFWKLWFLRQPTRTIPRTGIVSPASGKLTKIIAFSGKDVSAPKGRIGMVRTLTKDVARSGYVLIIMLTPLDVHYQRAPIGGTIVSIKHSPGKFRNAVFGSGDLKAIENEKCEIIIKGKETIKVIQVAGVAARRIETFVEQGQVVKRGEVIGLINFGSQVWLVMPKKRLRAKEGQRMIDGESVIA